VLTIWVWTVILGEEEVHLEFLKRTEFARLSPNSIKMFMWRVCNDLLPTKCNLLKRKMVEDSSCPCCCREEETVVHVLWSCPAAQDVWGGGTLIFQKCAFNGETVQQFRDFCMDRLRAKI
jgi:hypothetical protein